jgi:hypothetical protein
MTLQVEARTRAKEKPQRIAKSKALHREATVRRVRKGSRTDLARIIPRLFHGAAWPGAKTARDRRRCATMSMEVKRSCDDKERGGILVWRDQSRFRANGIRLPKGRGIGAI